MTYEAYKGNHALISEGSCSQMVYCNSWYIAITIISKPLIIMENISNYHFPLYFAACLETIETRATQITVDQEP